MLQGALALLFQRAAEGDMQRVMPASVALISNQAGKGRRSDWLFASVTAGSDSRVSGTSR
ncbi:hypothetical protein ULF88_21415 [Halopseudomonas pachastrellae]|nr:hypothetical protein [Halopseudomonas pachastrellae]